MRVRKILFLFCCAVLSGMVVAAVALPVAAVAGALTRAGVDTFDRLPTDFLSVPTPQTSFLYASDGRTLLAKFFDENRRDVPLADVAPVMRQSIVASEDTRFYSHRGVDIKGVARSAATGTGGASTLTMQYIRQSMIYSARTQRDVVAASERTNIRKIREMKLALALEKKLSKDQILERYLNIAPFGHGAWGIYAASHVYFDKEPGALTLSEAALLAGLVQAPSDYDPLDPAKRPAALQRREHVFAELVRAHRITPAQVDEARRAPLVFTDKQPVQGCLAVAATGAFCDYLYRWWLDQPAFGPDRFTRETRLRSGGYTIVSSIDLDAQRSAQRNVDSKIRNTDRRALMLGAVEPSTGRVLALAANREYSLDTSGNRPNPNPEKKGQPGTFPSTTNPLVTGGGGVNGYPAGSTFKMFTMVAALEQGIPLSHTIDTQARYHSHLYKTGPNDRSACSGSTDYCPGNASASEKGPFDMWTGFGHSVNTYFVPLEEQVGAEHVVDVARRMGIQFRAPGDRDQAAAAHTWGSFTLGVSGTTPLDLAGAYATLANDGVHCAPTPVVEIRDFNGQRIDAGKPSCQQAISADVAHAALDAARCPVGDHGGLGRCNGATASQVAGIVGRPVAGKTGTTDTNESATLVAMTRQVAVAGIEADPDWPGDSTADHTHVDAAVAATLRDAMRGKPPVDFPAPPKRLVGERPPAPSSARPTRH